MYPTSPRTFRRSLVPNTEISPRVGRVRPAIVRSRVVVPAPLSPSTTYSLPGANSAVTPRSAANRPNCFTTPSATTTAELDNVIRKPTFIASATNSRVGDAPRPDRAAMPDEHLGHRRVGSVIPTRRGIIPAAVAWILVAA